MQAMTQQPGENPLPDAGPLDGIAPTPPSLVVRVQTNEPLSSEHSAPSAGRITFTEEYKKELLDQGSRIPFFFEEKGRWQIMSKVDMKKEGVPSPGLWDTTCMAFLEDAHYITDEPSGQYSADDRVKTAREAADEEFAEA